MSRSEPSPPPSGPPSPPAAAQVATMTPAQAKRAGRGARDIALSLAALLIPIVILVGGYELLFNGSKPIAVDVSETYRTARHAGAFPVLEPAPLPDGWSANVGSYTPPGTPGTSGEAAGAVLRVVYHTPQGDGVQLVESNGPSDAVLAAELGTAAQPGNLLTVGGRQWREYPSAGTGGRALVCVEEGRTTVVIGTAPADRLREFVAALE